MSEPQSEMQCRAWRFTERGDPADVLSLTTIPMPVLSADMDEEWIVVKTAFVGLNVGSIFQMTLIPQFLRAKTCTAEMDFSGKVLGVMNPSRFAMGDSVLAMLPASHSLATGTGALAEYVAIPAKYAVKKPGGVSFADAAGCLLAGMTARKQVDESRAKQSDRVLVNAASGGIGTMVVQMVKDVVGKRGHVVGICSGKNVSVVKELGADEVIDYTQHADLPAYLASTYGDKPFNAIIDTLGHQSLYLASPKYLVQGGVYSSAGIKPPSFSVPNFLRAVVQMKLNEWWPVSTWMGGAGRLWRGVSMMEPTLREREDIALMMDKRKVKIVRDSVWEFEQVKEAYAKLGGLHARGKVLVRVNPEIGDDEC